MAARFVEFVFTIRQDDEEDPQVVAHYPEKDQDDCPFPGGLQTFGFPELPGLESAGTTEGGCAGDTQDSQDANRQQLTFFPASLTNEEGRRIFSLCLVHVATKEGQRTAQGLGIISRRALFEEHRAFLRELWLLFKKQRHLQMQRLIAAATSSACTPAQSAKMLQLDMQHLNLRIHAVPQMGLQPPFGAVPLLFKCLSPHQVISLVFPMLCERKVLLVSDSPNVLHACAEALIQLTFPFEYTLVYIPILPSGLLEFCAAPTPYLIGVHRSSLCLLPQLDDVIVCDLDRGAVTSGDGAPFIAQQLPDTSRLLQSVKRALHPELSTVDDVMPRQRTVSEMTTAPLILQLYPQLRQEVHIRLSFLTFFVELLQDYRQYFVSVRVNPDHVSHLDKGALFHARSLACKDARDDQNTAFLRVFVDTMAFNQLVKAQTSQTYAPTVFDRAIDRHAAAAASSVAEPLTASEVVRELWSDEAVDVVLPPIEGLSHKIDTTAPLSAALHMDVLRELAVQAIATRGTAPEAPSPTITRHRLPMRPQSIMKAPPPQLPRVVQSCSRIFKGPEDVFVQWYIKSFRSFLQSVQKESVAFHVAQELASAYTMWTMPISAIKFDIVVKLVSALLTHEQPVPEDNAPKRPIDRVAVVLLPLIMHCYTAALDVRKYVHHEVALHPLWQDTSFWFSALFYTVEQKLKRFYGNRFNILEDQVDLNQPMQVPDPEAQAAMDAEEEALVFQQLGLLMCHMVQLGVPEHDVQTFVRTAVAVLHLPRKRLAALMATLPNQVAQATTTSTKLHSNKVQLQSLLPEAAGFEEASKSRSLSQLARDTPSLGSVLLQSEVEIMRLQDAILLIPHRSHWRAASGLIIVTNYRIIFDGALMSHCGGRASAVADGNAASSNPTLSHTTQRTQHTGGEGVGRGAHAPRSKTADLATAAAGSGAAVLAKGDRVVQPREMSGSAIAEGAKGSEGECAHNEDRILMARVRVAQRVRASSDRSGGSSNCAGDTTAEEKTDTTHRMPDHPAAAAAGDDSETGVVLRSAEVRKSILKHRRSAGLPAAAAADIVGDTASSAGGAGHDNAVSAPITSETSLNVSLDGANPARTPVERDEDVEREELSLLNSANMEGALATDENAGDDGDIGASADEVTRTELSHAAEIRQVNGDEGGLADEEEEADEMDEELLRRQLEPEPQPRGVDDVEEEEEPVDMPPSPLTTSTARSVASTFSDNQPVDTVRASATITSIHRVKWFTIDAGAHKEAAKWEPRGIVISTRNMSTMRVCFPLNRRAAMNDLKAKIHQLCSVQSVQNTFAYFTGHKRDPWRQDDNKIKVTTAVRRALNRKATTRLSFAPHRRRSQDTNTSDSHNRSVIGFNSSVNSVLEFLPEDAGLQDTVFLSDAGSSATVQALKRDMDRLGFGAKRQSGCIERWRPCFANRKYKISESYSPLLYVPAEIDDEELSRCCVHFHHERIPTLTWIDRNCGGAILVSSLCTRPAEASVRNLWNLIDSTAEFVSTRPTMPNVFNVIERLPERFKRHPRVVVFTHGADVMASLPAGWRVVDPSATDEYALAYTGETLRQSYVELQALCNEVDVSSFLSRVEGTNWLSHVASLLHWACVAAEFVSTRRSTVLLSLGSGRDEELQLSSLTSILLDPHYRTLGGFKTLIEKDWLLLGHAFASRSGIRDDSLDAPFFLLFLDAVHQLVRQFPSAFEFTPHFVAAIAYHSTSGRFGTFLFDCERERSKCPMAMASLWDFIQRIHHTSPQWFNFEYNPRHAPAVLAPSFEMPALHLWSELYFPHLRGPSNNFIYERALPWGDINNRFRPVVSKLARLVHALQKKHDGVTWLMAWEHVFTAAAAPPPRPPPPPVRTAPARIRPARPPPPLPSGAKRIADVGIANGPDTKAKSSGAAVATTSFVTNDAMPLGTPPRHRRRNTATLSKASPSRPSHFRHRKASAGGGGARQDGSAGGIVQAVATRLASFSRGRDRPVQPAANGDHDEAEEEEEEEVENAMVKDVEDEDADWARNPQLPARSASISSSSNYATFKGMHRTNHVDLQAYMYKLGGLIKNWRYRWFFLDVEQLEIRYYRPPHNQELLGRIDLRDVSAVEYVQQFNSLRGLFVKLTTKRRTWVLKALSKEVWVEWLSVLMDICPNLTKRHPLPSTLSTLPEQPSRATRPAPTP